MTTFAQMQTRGGTAAEWATANPILLEREMGVETDTNQFKFGDGTSAWNDLAYAGGSGGGSVSDAAYNATTWNGVTGVAPSKNAVRDEVEVLVAAIAANIAQTITNGVTTSAPSQDTVFDALALKADVSALAALISDTAYAGSWDGVTGVAPSKNAVYDKIEALDVAKAPKTPTVGTGLGTTGTVDLDMSALDGTVQWITATGNITFTTSNKAAGRNIRIFIDAGGSTRTLAYPAWIAHGAALPTSLASGKRLALSILSLGTTDANISAAASAQP